MLLRIMEVRMSHHQKSVLALLLAIVLYSGSAHAQQSNSTAETAPTANAELRGKAFDLLETVASQLNTLQSAENRARIGSNIVGSLWEHDEKRARSLLALVQEDIKAAMQYQESDDEGMLQTLLVFMKLRADTVERVVKHDPELALAFFKATELTSDKPLPPHFAESEQALELQLAQQVAAKNPEVAVQIGRSSLARGFSHTILSLVQQVNRRHKDQALILYKEIVRKLRDVDLRQDWNARALAQSLAYSFPPPAANDSTFRDLMRVFTASASKNGCGNRISEENEKAEFCRWAASTLENMENINSALSAKRARAGELMYAGSAAYAELTDLTRGDGTVDEILALAEKYPESEAEIHWRAMTKARESGDIERARTIATNYAGSAEIKKAMLNQIEQDQRFASVDERQLAEIQSALNSIPDPRERVLSLVYVANQVGRNDRKTALKLLNQATEIADTMRPGNEQTKTHMALAMMYCIEKSDRGFAIMQSMLPKLNELVEAAAKLDGYDTGYLSQGEWNMSANGNVGDLLTLLAKNAQHFAWYDFDRAVSLAAQFERVEIRLMAQLKLAQGILAGPPKRFVMGGGPPIVKRNL
jgi:hypothetical protein